VDTFRPQGARIYGIVSVNLFVIMEFLRRKTLLTIAVVLMVLLVSEAHVVEGLPAQEVKEPTPKLDKLKVEPQLKNNSSKEAAPAEKPTEQGDGGEASAGEDDKKGGEETSNLKSGGDDDGGSADTNGGDDGHSETTHENMKNPASINGEATNGSNTNGEDAPPNVTLDQSKTTTNLSSTQLTTLLDPESDGNENGNYTLTDAHDTKTSTGSDTMATDGSSVGSSFVSTGSSTSSSPPIGNPEIPPPGKQKPTESNKTAQSEGSAMEKEAGVKPEVDKLEEQSSIEGKEVASQEKTAKGPNPEPIPNDLPAVDSEISKKEDHIMDVNEEDVDAVKEESKVDTPFETSFEKQMGSGAPDPPQTNFFSYFIVLAIITIVAYLVFHNKKKILGLIVEGRSGKQAGRRRSGGREYRKLDSNMEDMMETGKETNMRQVIY